LNFVVFEICIGPNIFVWLVFLNITSGFFWRNLITRIFQVLMCRIMREIHFTSITLIWIDRSIISKLISHVHCRCKVLRIVITWRTVSFQILSVMNVIHQNPCLPMIYRHRRIPVIISWSWVFFVGAPWNRSRAWSIVLRFWGHFFLV